MSELSLQDRLLLIYTLATVVQVIVVAVSLIFIHHQARAARRTVDRIDKTERFNAYVTHRQDVFEVNKLLIRDPELASLLGYSKKEILAFVLIGYTEMMYWHKNYNIVDPGLWQSFFQLARKVFNLNFVAHLWDEVKLEYTEDFVRFVENLRNLPAPTLRENRDF